MDITNFTLEFFVAFVHLVWIGFWWFIGHLFWYLLAGKPGTSLDDSGLLEPLGVLTLFCSEVLFLYIARHVLNFIYKKELPGGEDFVKEMTSLLGASKNKQKRK